jgi:hypothetical protein
VVEVAVKDNRPLVALHREKKEEEKSEKKTKKQKKTRKKKKKVGSQEPLLCIARRSFVLGDAVVYVGWFICLG